MTIVADAHVQQRTWRGYDDPGLPVGMFITQGTVLGDASGGRQLVIFTFKGEAEPASGRFYNLEQVEIHYTQVGSIAFALVATNWDIIGPTGLVNRQWGGSLADNNNNVTAMTTFLQLPLPIFLGTAAPVSALSAQLEVGVPNILAQTLLVTLQGYIWEPRSVMAEGGLRRPVDSLYGGGRQ